MIQFKRGKTQSWRGDSTILSPGQPGYDKDKHKIKIGDGKHHWNLLPYASGLAAEEILNSEAVAKARAKLDLEDQTIITYGTEAPDKNTVGQVYLQYYDADPEADYIVESGSNGIWRYQKWHSGIAKCSGVLNLTTSVQNAFEAAYLFYDNKSMKQINYPFTFKEIPSEVATLHSPGGISWLSSRGTNSKTKSGLYSIISPDSLESASYSIALQVEGIWK